MYQVPVFLAEAGAGLAHAVGTRASVAFAAPLEEVVDGDPLGTSLRRSPSALALAGIGSVPDAIGDPELFYMKDVLVTSCWNVNGDVFDRVETYAARHSSRDKPLNFEHDQSDIIGHIVASQAVDADMVPLAEDLAVDDIPDRFHVVNGSVIYRHIGDDDRKALIEKTIAEIRRGEWYVSMEALFRGFDYAIRDPEGAQHVVARTEATAWLTKYLRAYPPDPDRPMLDPQLGSGTFVERSTGARYEVGRLMRNLTFCGKGLVRKPANPESVILATAASSTFRPSQPAPVYLVASEQTPTPREIPDMSEVADAGKLQAKIDELAAANQVLRTEVADLKSKDVQAKVTALEADLTAAQAQVTSLEAQVSTITASQAEVVKRAEQAEADLATASADLATLKSEKVRADRKAALVEKKAPTDQVDTLLANLASLDDAAFAGTVAVISASWKSAVTPAKTEVQVIDSARVEADVALATATTTPVAEAEAAFAKVADFFATTVVRPGRGRAESAK